MLSLADRRYEKSHTRTCHRLIVYAFQGLFGRFFSEAPTVFFFSAAVIIHRKGPINFVTDFYLKDGSKTHQSGNLDLAKSNVTHFKICVLFNHFGGSVIMAPL